MCGIAGMIGEALGREPRLDVLRRMVSTIRHRGPDAESVWVDDSGQCGLAHARLSIIDLSTGDQPIANEDGGVVVVFNGEIYNYQELREELLRKGHVFKTRSDTEVLVHLFEEEGVAMAKRLRGMFAIALWETRSRRLHLIRDHIGKKPLYFHRRGDALFFASEYKAFLPLEGFSPGLDGGALHHLLNLRWLPSGSSLMRGVEQVLPGEVLTFANGQVERQRYWLPKVMAPVQLSQEEHEENILALLRQAVRRRLVADVPVGLFLSGGIDSSAILALMAELSDRPVRSFSLGFGNANDETEEAAETAAYYGAVHRNFQIDENPLRYYSQSIWHSEVPKVNAVQLYLLSEKARQEVKVVMSGLGGDELFGGYDNYLFIKYAGALADIPMPRLGRALGRAAFRLGGSGQVLPHDEFRRGMQMGLSFGRRHAFYGILRNVWDDDPQMYDRIYHPDRVAQQRSFSTTELLAPYFSDHQQDFLAQAMTCELREKIVGDQILVEDRNMMAHGVEGRDPFLDVDLIEYAATVPTELKISAGRGRKYILKQALRRVLPEFVFNRPKKGFAFDPVRQFERDLKPLAQAVLSPERIESMGVFNPAYIRQLLDTPVSNRLHWHYWLLWTMVGVTLWHDAFVDGHRDQSRY